VDDVEALIAGARARLTAAGAPREALGRWRGRRFVGIPLAPNVVPAGSAWHLGVLLIGPEDVFATGEIVRARPEVRRGFAAESQRRRADVAAAASRGGFADGQVVHLGWERLDLAAVGRGEASGPLRPGTDGPEVRWSARGGWRPLAAYLDERIALLLDPPSGAT